MRRGHAGRRQIPRRRSASPARSNGSTTPRASASWRAMTAARTCSSTSRFWARRASPISPRVSRSICAWSTRRRAARRSRSRRPKADKSTLQSQGARFKRPRAFLVRSFERLGMTPSRDIDRLLEIMAALRTPGSGCPWDLEQDFSTIAPYTIEEAYEVADAIERGDFVDLRDELGDLLLQVVFHARMAEEAKLFDFGGVVEAITTKLIRRHPHVFGEARNLSPEAVKSLWAAIKAEEKRERAAAHEKSGAPPAPSGALSGVPLPLPALSRALKL